jgi:hypothetical protein
MQPNYELYLPSNFAAFAQMVSQHCSLNLLGWRVKDMLRPCQMDPPLASSWEMVGSILLWVMQEST